MSDSSATLAILEPSNLQPVQVVLVGKLHDVLLGAGYLEDEADTGALTKVQLIRFACGSREYARLCRIRIQVPGQTDWVITPRDDSDEIYLERWIPQGSRLKVRLERGENVSPAILPTVGDPARLLGDPDVRLEVFG